MYSSLKYSIGDCHFFSNKTGLLKGERTIMEKNGVPLFWRKSLRRFPNESLLAVKKFSVVACRKYTLELRQISYLAKAERDDLIFLDT